MNPREPNKGCQSKRRHEVDGTVGNLSERGETRTEIADQKPGKQRTNARAERDSDVADGTTHENTNEAAKENRKAQHNEIDAGAGRNDDADALGRVLHDRFWSDDT